MRLRRLWLTDFRSYEAVELAPAEGLTVIVGANGEGKTNLLEAIGYLATLSSFRGAPGDALLRQGCSTAPITTFAIHKYALIYIIISICIRQVIVVCMVVTNRTPCRLTADIEIEAYLRTSCKPTASCKHSH